MKDLSLLPGSYAFHVNAIMKNEQKDFIFIKNSLLNIRPAKSKITQETIDKNRSKILKIKNLEGILKYCYNIILAGADLKVI